MNVRAAGWWVLVGVVLSAAPAFAQQTASSRQAGERRFELAVLGGVFGGADLGGVPANMSTNGVPSSGQAALFTTKTSISDAPVVDGRVGVRIAGGWWAEGGFSYARPDFAVRLSADTEGAPDVTATSRLTQVVADGALQHRWTGRRVSPFVMAGGGILRQLDQPRTTAETGSVVYAGGGVRVRLSRAPRGWTSRLALRGDARLVWLRGGIRLAEERGPTFVVVGGLTYGL